MGRRGHRLHRHITQARTRGAPALALLIALAASAAHAQITADTAPGRSVGTSVTPGPGTWSITGGTTIGGVNLFHSFSEFGLPAGTATFSGAPGIGNIISRVTGGARSDINGTVASTISGANLWFINPAGIAFGPNALLNVQGSFHASTASYVKFGANGQFGLSGAPAATFSVNPSAFGFLGAPAPISLDRSALTVPAGRTLSLVGGDITATGTVPARVRIEAPGGRINLASLAGPGEATFAATGAIAAVEGSQGAITLGNTIVRTEIAGAPGPIAIRGGRLTLTDSFISTVHASPAAGADIDISLSGDFAMTGGVIRASSRGTGDAGNVVLRAANVSLAGGAVVDTSAIDTQTYVGTGRAGQTTIEASGDVVLSGGAALTSITFLGSGPGGDLRINARSLSVRDNANIKVSTFGDGAAGRVRVAVQDLRLSGGGHIDANTEFDTSVSPGMGAGGSIVVDANRVEISGAGSGMFSRTTSNGPGGSIVVNAGDLVLRDGGQIGSESQAVFGTGTGNAGSVRLAAARTVEIAGAGAGVFSSTVTPGAGGAIEINAQDIRIRDGGRISGESSNPNLLAAPIGNAGSIRLAAARTVEIAGAGSGLFSSTTSSGAGGTIEVSARDILIRDGGRISGESSNPNNFARVGDAGSIALNATSAIRLEDNGGITTESVGAGGGRITIQANDLLALDRSRITTSVRFGGGNGGDILIDPVFVTLNASDIIARAVDGNGGNIFIVTQFLLQSPDSNIDATSQRGISGSVQISSPASDVGSRLGVLGSGYVDPSALLREACAARAGRAGSSFVGVGRGGLPASPDSAAYAGYSPASNSTGYAPASPGSSREAWMGLTIRAASCPGPHTG